MLQVIVCNGKKLHQTILQTVLQQWKNVRLWKESIVKRSDFCVNFFTIITRLFSCKLFLYSIFLLEKWEYHWSESTESNWKAILTYKSYHFIKKVIDFYFFVTIAKFLVLFSLGVLPISLSWYFSFYWEINYITVHISVMLI